MRAAFVAFPLLVSAIVAVHAQAPAVSTAVPVTMRCGGEGVVVISDSVRITCDGSDFTIAQSDIRAVALGAARPRFVIPLTAVGGIPVGHKHDRLELAVVGRDGLEHVVFLRVKEDDLIPGLKALAVLTGLSVFTERLEDRLTAAGVSQTVGRYRPAVSAEQRARADDLSPWVAQMTDTGDSLIVYGNGRAVLWNPATTRARPLGEGRERTGDRRCFPPPAIVGLHQRTAAVFSCGHLVVYDLDSGAALTDLTVEHPGAAALNPADGAIYRFESGQLHRWSTTPPTTEAPPVHLDEEFDRLVFSPRGDFLLCSRAWKKGRAASDVHVYRFDRGTAVGGGIRIRDLKIDADQIGVHPDGTRIAALDQRMGLAVRDRLRFWDLEPVPRQVKEVVFPKGVNVVGSRVHYSVDGSTIVAGGRPAIAVDAGSGEIRCAVPESLREATRPNAQGLSAGVAYEGWQIGDLPRVLMWDSTTCVVRGALDPELELLRPAGP